MQQAVFLLRFLTLVCLFFISEGIKAQYTANISVENCETGQPHDDLVEVELLVLKGDLIEPYRSYQLNGSSKLKITSLSDSLYVVLFKNLIGNTSYAALKASKIDTSETLICINRIQNHYPNYKPKLLQLTEGESYTIHLALGQADSVNFILEIGLKDATYWVRFKNEIKPLNEKNKAEILEFETYLNGIQRGRRDEELFAYKIIYNGKSDFFYHDCCGCPSWFLLPKKMGFD